MDTEEVNFRTSQQRAKKARSHIYNFSNGDHVEWSFRTGKWFWFPIRHVIDPGYWTVDFANPDATVRARITTWYWFSFGCCLVEVKA